MIRRGEPWEEAAPGPPEIAVQGGDRALAKAVGARPGAVVRWDPEPGSDLASTLGLTDRREREPSAGMTIGLDALVVDGEHWAVNAVVVGTPPTRMRWWSRRAAVEIKVDGRRIHAGPATCVLVANGQYWSGADAVPRGHPGDGRCEVHVYHGLRRREARELRRRIATGRHLPHPGVLSSQGARVEIAAGAELPLWLDGERVGRVSSLAVELRAQAFRLLV